MKGPIVFCDPLILLPKVIRDRGKTDWVHIYTWNTNV